MEKNKRSKKKDKELQTYLNKSVDTAMKLWLIYESKKTGSCKQALLFQRGKT